MQNTDWSYIGAKLAQATDAEQADMFKGFVKELGTFETRYQAEMQLCSVNRLLSQDEIELLKSMTHEEN